MAGNFWTSSHCNYWTLDRHEAELAKIDLQHNLSDKELDLVKMFVADFTQQVGHRLKLRQQIVATAIVYLRRFYSKCSYTSGSIPLLVVTALYLACKVEEFGNVQVRNFIQPLVSMLKKEFAEIYGDQNITIDQAQIIEAEFYILEELDCYTIVFNPYRDLIAYVEHAGFPQEVLTQAWYILNDSYRTDVCLRQPPCLVALSALYLATSVSDHATPTPLQHQAAAWFADLNVNLDQVLEICRTLLSMYRLWDEYSLPAMKRILRKLPRPVPVTNKPHSLSPRR